MVQEMDAVSEIIGLIYETACEPASWPTALESIANYTHASSAALIYQDINPQSAGDLYTYNISAEISARHKAYGIDPNFQIMSEHVPLGTAAAIDHIITDRKKLESIYGEKFNKLLKDGGMYYLAGAILSLDDNRVSAISLQRKKSLGGWKKSQIDRLNILIPHIRRAINIKKKFERLKTKEHALHVGLDKLLMGLILFDNGLRPIYINPVARSILKNHPAINLKNNRISTHTRSQTEKIKAALAAAVSSEISSDTGSRSTAFGLKHPDCATTLPVIISHVQGMLHGFETEGSHAHAVMCFSDPDAAYPIEADKLSDIYQLTPAEAQVAISIANGISTDQIAVINKVAISTVRSQLKAIYHKLGVSSQPALVKVLLTGPFSQKL